MSSVYTLVCECSFTCECNVMRVIICSVVYPFIRFAHGSIAVLFVCVYMYVHTPQQNNGLLTSVAAVEFRTERGVIRGLQHVHFVNILGVIFIFYYVYIDCIGTSDLYF